MVYTNVYEIDCYLYFIMLLKSFFVRTDFLFANLCAIFFCENEKEIALFTDFRRALLILLRK